MKRRYITVEINTDVDVTIEEVLDGMNDEDKRDLIRQLEKDLSGESSPRATVPLTDSILDRHRNEHEAGPVWACMDSVCEAWSHTTGAA